MDKKDNQQRKHNRDVVSVQALKRAYELLDLATENERKIGAKIFPVPSSHTQEESDKLILQYKEAKWMSVITSLHAAELFIRATPEVREGAN